MKDISVIGIGRLGLCFALNLESKGYKVIGVDVNQPYIDSLNNKTFTTSEPGVEALLAKSKDFVATTDITKALENDVIFVVVPTPSSDLGTFNQCYINDIVAKIEKQEPRIYRKYLVIQSTTTPTYCESIAPRLANANYEVSYNPEFIAQGTIIRDQLNPDVVLIGQSSVAAGDIVEEIYRTLCENKPNIVRMTPTEAEITKIALNCFLTTKIAYANMVGDLALKTHCRPDVILSAIGSDSRIGQKYLRYGFGYGGPCFPRDNRAFGVFCERNGIYPHISYATDKSNQSHLIYQVDHFAKNYSKGTATTVDGVTFKEGSTILEESQQLKYAFELKDLGYDVTIRDCAEVIAILARRFGSTFKYEVRKS